MFPRKFTFIIAFVSMLLLCIPIYYGVTYGNTKVDIFPEEIQKIEENIKAYEDDPKANEKYTFTKMNYKKFNDFGLTITAEKFDLESKFNARYKVEIKKENLPNGKIVGSIQFKLALAANWIKFYETGSSSISSSYLYDDDTQYNNTTISISNLKPLIERTNYFIPFPKPTIYLLISYDFKEDNKDKLVHNNILLDYQYMDIPPISGGYPA